MQSYLDISLSQKQFDKLRSLMYQVSGVNIQPGKEGLVSSRLTKRLRRLKLHDFDAYLAFIHGQEGHDELLTMIDSLTTNKTSFYREGEHFELLAKQVLPEHETRAGKHLRIWSAGCSSGEEPYTLAMILHETLRLNEGWDAKILATDISLSMLQRAREGVYDKGSLGDLPTGWESRYFDRLQGNDGLRCSVKANLRGLVHLAHLNLMKQWPMKGPFDMIFCRNVMIYFDQDTRDRLLERFHALLRPGGYLFLGHSETMGAVSRDKFNYIQPAAFQK